MLRTEASAGRLPREQDDQRPRSHRQRIERGLPKLGDDQATGNLVSIVALFFVCSTHFSFLLQVIVGQMFTTPKLVIENPKH